MDIIELIKREHAKTNGLIEKLTDTSDGAVTTRERLVSQLKAGLEAHMGVVQDHVYPLLRKNDDTRDLVPELKERNELKRQLADLERTPKDDDGFLAKVKELKKLVEQHLRAEEKRIFPAVKKAIGGEEAEELAKRIAAQTREELQEAKEQAEETAGTGAEVVKLAANTAAEGTRRLGSAVERNAETARQSADALSRSARKTATDTAETGRRAMDAAAAGSRRLVESTADQARRAGQSTLNAAKTYTDMGQRTAEDLRALITAPTAATGAMQEMQKAWADWFGQAAQANARAAQALLRCATLQQVAEVQRDVLSENLRAWLEGGARVLRTVRQTSGAVLRPLEARIDQAEREDRRRTSTARRRDAA
jgi:hemerythrin superfamily protein